MFCKSRLKKIEEVILAIRRDGIIDSESFGNSANVRKTKREAEIANLEAERSFIMDRRNGWKQKIFWNVIVAIIVSIITTVIIKYWLK
jgi:hypothetical protein